MRQRPHGPIPYLGANHSVRALPKCTRCAIAKIVVVPTRNWRRNILGYKWLRLFFQAARHRQQEMR